MGQFSVVVALPGVLNLCGDQERAEDNRGGAGDRDPLPAISDADDRDERGEDDGPPGLDEFSSVVEPRPVASSGHTSGTRLTASLPHCRVGSERPIVSSSNSVTPIAVFWC